MPTCPHAREDSGTLASTDPATAPDTHNRADILAFLPEAVIEIGAGHIITYVNAMAEIIFGHTREDMIGKPLEILIPPEYRAGHQQHVHRFHGSAAVAYLMHGRQSVTGLRRDGTRFPAEASIVKTQRNGQTVVTTILRDVTMQHMQRERIKASEAKQQEIMACCPDAILIVDAETGMIQETNEAATSLFHCQPGSLVGIAERRLHLQPETSCLEALFRAGPEAKPVRAAEAMLRRPDGTTVPVEISARRIELGGTTLLVGFYRAIAHHKAREQRLQEALERAAQSTRSKTMFLANMSHELRTPLNGIIGFSQMISMELHGRHSHPKYQEYGRMISQGAEHLLSLVNDVLDISAIDTGTYKLNWEPLKLRMLFQDCLNLLHPVIESGGQEVNIICPPDLILEGDRRSVKQMIINLLGNAVKFTPRLGSVSIIAETNTDGVSVCVRDTGCGIKPADLPTVLEPFSVSEDVYTRVRGGAGLGLAITKRLIELHGGRISIESKVGVGTAVALRFPRRP